MIRRPPRSTLDRSSAASDVYKRQQQGYRQLGLIGTSLGSCYGFIASAHDPRIRVAAFNHASTYFADVVWHGQTTRHIRQGVEGEIDLDRLRKLWLAASPMV